MDGVSIDGIFLAADGGGGGGMENLSGLSSDLNKKNNKTLPSFVWQIKFSSKHVYICKIRIQDPVLDPDFI